MSIEDKKFAKLQKSAFNYALYRVRNFEAAEAISLEVMSLYLLQYNKISNAEKWVINACKIHCQKLFRQEKREKDLTNSLHTELSNHIEKFSEDNQKLRQAFQESYQALNDDELSTLLYYFHCDQSIKTMHETTEESYAALRQKISRIKKKLKAETFRRLGYYGSKKIVTPQLNSLIKTFLKRFKQHAEADTLDKMFYYFSEVDLQKFDLTFGLKKILDYDIVIENSIYKTWVIFEDSVGTPKSFTMSFIIDDNNHLKITSPPKLLKQLAVVKADSLPGKELSNVLAKIPEDLSGHPELSKEDLQKFLLQLEKNKQNPE
ncbi:MAG: hypothetical protein R6U84_06785 [Candidatus Cloacimonadales bacterium]